MDNSGVECVNGFAKNRKGQITAVNMVVLFLVMMLFLALAPSLIEYGENTINDVTISYPTYDQIDMLALVIRLLPFALGIGILLTLLGYALPRQESLYR